MGPPECAERRERDCRRIAAVQASRTVRHLLIGPLLLALSVPLCAQPTVRVGVYDNPPKVEVDRAGIVSGLFPELLEVIAEEAGWAVRYVPGTWTESLDRLDRGEIDLMVDVAFTAPRQQLYAFNEETVLVNWGTVYTRAGVEVLSLPELEGLRIAVMRESTHTVDPGGILDLVDRFQIKATFIELDSYQEVFAGLSSGVADAGVVNRVFGLTFESEYGVERTPIVFNPIELRFALPRDGPLTPMLVAEIDRQLRRLKDNPDSVYYSLLEKHLLSAPVQETVVRSPPWLLPALLSAGGSIVILIGAVVWVRREARHRARAEEAYRLSEERFELAMRGANDAVWDRNLVTGEVYYSPRWARMLGYEPREIAPTIETFQQLLHPDDRESVLRAEENCLSGRSDRYQAEFRMRHHDGSLVDVLSRAFLVRNQDGRPIRIVGTHVDITERRRAAAELEEAKERAEAADRLKSAFLATMSHELRTPLNSIIGFTGILLQRLAGPLTDEQEKQLGMVRTSARHLLELINDVLDISKIEAGQLEVTSESFDLRDLIEKAVATARPLAEEKGLDVQVEVAPEVAEVLSDRRRVNQILTNLLSNAIKFTEAGFVRVSCRLDGGDVILVVEDTGIGIDEKDLPGLFVPFRQIDSGLTRKYEGTGLGLSICRRLSEKLGGTIGVKSELGRGSRFTVRLPKEL